jgi:ATP-binding cassette, subfamily B (MDR/TAP), member 1
MSILTIVMSVGSIAAPASAVARAAGSSAIFHTIIDAPKPNIKGLKAPDVSANEDIVLEQVNFAYPLRPDLKVLDELSLRFPAGKISAIVGPSGSGKSTIVSLLQRWYELDGNETTNLLVRESRVILS